MIDIKDDLQALRLERKPEPSGPGRLFGWLLPVVVLASSAAGVWWWATRERPIEIQVAAVTERAIGIQASVLNASGYVTARRRATISSKITGKIVEVNVEEGMAVREGQVLARLDESNAEAALKLAEAQLKAAQQNITENEVRLAEARLTLDRREQLVKDHIVSQAEVDQARAEVDSISARITAAREAVHVAERQVELQQADLDNTIIRAPFSGVVVTKDAQPGEIISPVSAGGGYTRTGICTIVDMESLEVEVDVNESYINRVTQGQEVTAVLNAYPDWLIPGHVITMVPTADRQKATVLVRIAFEKLDPRILPDMGVKVTFLRHDEAPSTVSENTAETRPVLLIPKTAIRVENGRDYVFVTRANGTVERRAISTGGEDGSQVEVSTGLSRGEQVVAPVPATIRDGSKVRVAS